VIGPVTVSLPAADRSRPFGAGASSSALEVLRSATGSLSRTWTWLQERRAVQLNSRRLRVIETISLGDKRFVAVVQVDELQFLIGGGPTAVALLAQLDPHEPFGDVLAKTTAVRKKRPAQRRSPSAKGQSGAGS
jgi:hypothetical protein